MKKLIAISVMLALVAGAAFAQLGVEVFATAGVKGGGDADLDPTTTFAIPRARISGSGQNDDGTVGAAIRFQAEGNAMFVDGGEYDWSTWPTTPNMDEINRKDGVVGYAWAWWKPIEQIKLQIGSNGGDGEFGLEGLTGWGFEGLGYEVGMGAAPWGADVLGWQFSRRDVFYSGWNAPGFYVGVYPVEGLAFHVGLGFDGETLVEDVFDTAHIQGTYNLDGVGLFGVTYVGGGDEDGKVYVFADLAIVDGLGLNVGLSYDLEAEDIGIGIGAQYDVNDQFGFKAVLTALIPDAIDYVLLVDLLPYYKINDTMTFFGSVCIATWDGDNSVSWQVNPYLKISTGWCQDFYAGVKFKSHNDADADWAFIMGITMGF